MSFLDKFFNKLVTRFRLYIAYNNETKYVLKGNSPILMIGYVADYFKNGSVPLDGWALYFASGATQKHFKLDSSHFIYTGSSINDSLLKALDEMDERWRFIEGPELKFENFTTQRELPISSNNLNSIDWSSKNTEDLLKKINDRGEDWFNVMDRVFGIEH